jgi:FkbM family methyltransferase
VVFDVGANAGFFTLLASKLVGSEGAVYAFEPLPRNLGYLQEHIRINDAANVTVLPIAVSDRTGLARFESSGNPAMGGLSERGGLEVQIESLDRLWTAGAITSPCFIKMDIEGGESSALAGAVELLREARPVILLSTHGHVQHERCVGRLSDLGYEIELLRDGARDGDYLIRAVPRGGQRRPTPYPTS